VRSENGDDPTREILYSEAGLQVYSAGMRVEAPAKEVSTEEMSPTVLPLSGAAEGEARKTGTAAILSAQVH